MKHSMDKDSITAMAKKTLLQMSRFEIPLCPDNYHLWFDYSSRTDQCLVDEINRMIADGVPFSDTINADLYRKYFADQDSKLKTLADAQGVIQNVLKEVLSEVLNTQGFTSNYQKELREFSISLDNIKDVGEFREIVAGLMRRTLEVIEAGQQLKEHLAVMTSKSEELQKQLCSTQHELLRDPLTGIYNRKAFDEKISAYIEAYRKDDKFFSLVIIDIDHFKNFNDRHGHLLGDQVLKFVGKLLTNELKGKDFVGRYGGEEFVLLMEGASLDNAVVVANKIRGSFANVQLKYSKSGQIIGKITVSAGVATIQGDDTPESLIKRADDALYMAKQYGRNAVKSEKDLPDKSGHDKLITYSDIKIVNDKTTEIQNPEEAHLIPQTSNLPPLMKLAGSDVRSTKDKPKILS